MSLVNIDQLRRRALGTALLAFGMLLGGAAQAQDWGVDTLMQLLAQNRSSRATFVEQKYLSAVEAPLESSGELVYEAPDRLEKRTLKPSPESLVLDKDVLLLERKGRKRSIPLQSYPEVGAFVESIRATLAGDRKALDQNYQVALEGKRDRWHLLLRPLQAKAAAMVSQVKLSGERERVDTIEILQGNGDRSVMTITPAPTSPSPR
ncbi:MAG: acyltransferase [Leptothrix sp. (in: Bacteria)]|nr:acyltransferase [Leptothrix sp. (in: b-proteobacteria)]